MFFHSGRCWWIWDYWQFYTYTYYSIAYRRQEDEVFPPCKIWETKLHGRREKVSNEAHVKILQNETESDSKA